MKWKMYLFKKYKYKGKIYVWNKKYFYERKDVFIRGGGGKKPKIYFKKLKIKKIPGIFHLKNG